MFGYGTNCRVSNGCTNIKAIYHELKNGRFTLTDRQGEDNIKIVVTVKNSTIATQRTIINGKTVYFCEYGKAERERGVYSLRFRKGTNRGLDGLSTRWDCEVLGYKGITKTFYRRGRLIWQTFRHENGRLCYAFHAGKQKPLIFYYPNGKVMAELSGKIDSARKFDGYTLFGHEKVSAWSENNFSFVQYSKGGLVTNKGKIENRQRVGVWTVNGRRFYYINGLEVSARMYETPPEKLKVNEILSMDNADVRSIFIERIGFERLVKEAKPIIVHKQADMKLLRFNIRMTQTRIFGEEPDPHFQLLQVKCPSTGQQYYLRVPPHYQECEKARQWTFGIEGNQKPIKFDIEV